MLADDTVLSVQNRKNGSLRKLAESLGYPASFAATLSDVLNRKHGKVSHERENELRERLGLNVLPAERILVPPCPDCGQVHTGRCHGRPVVSVAVLAPGEQVAAVERIAGDGERIVRRHRPVQRWRDMSVTELARALRERRVMGREE